MKKIKISAVSYTNSKAFIYGLEHSSIINKIDLQKDIPTDCAEKLINDRVDIGLIPVATLPLVPNAQIIGNYCIGSDGAVNSVFVLSNKPLSDIKTILLDSHSRTSNDLTKVLFYHYFKKDITYLAPHANSLSDEADAFVLIGDRTFGVAKNYETVIDLGKVWNEFTGLPFVFAAWVANKNLPSVFIEEFNEALKFGLDNLDIVIKDLDSIQGINLNHYFYNNLSFNFDSAKNDAIKLFLQKIESLPR